MHVRLFLNVECTLHSRDILESELWLRLPRPIPITKNKSLDPLDNTIKPDRWLYLILSRWRGTMSVSGATKIPVFQTECHGLRHLYLTPFRFEGYSRRVGNNVSLAYRFDSLRMPPSAKRESRQEPEMSGTRATFFRRGTALGAMNHLVRAVSSSLSPLTTNTVPHPAGSIKFPWQKRIRS